MGVGLGVEDGSGRGLCCGEMRQGGRAGLGRFKEGALQKEREREAAAQSNVDPGEPAGAGDQRHMKGWSDMVHQNHKHQRYR